MNLNEFLVKAKINTYASNREGIERKLEDGARELIYEDGEYKYRDRYFGSIQFIGEEIVWQNDKVIWAINYYGGLISNDVSSEDIYKFLKRALKLVDVSMPFRGPVELIQNELKYKNIINGNIEKFDGIESIFYHNKKVYELKYCGGFIKQ